MVPAENICILIKEILCRLWDTGTREVEVTFTGHKTAVSCLAWDRAGLRLVSGSRDTAVIVWDVVAECGIARLQGHKVRADTYLYLHLHGESGHGNLLQFFQIYLH